MNHYSLKNAAIKEDELVTERRRGVVMVTSGTATNVWTVLSVRKAFILVGERCFWMRVTDALGSAEVCYVRYIWLTVTLSC